jgi:predicted DNA-binding ribbon-helix-helix protein
VKRSIAIDGHRTSISVEAPFWDGLGEIARASNKSVAALIGEIDHGRDGLNLSAAIRVHVLAWYRARAGETPQCRP